MSNELLELLGRFTLAASYQIDRRGIVLEWGTMAEHLFGWSAHEALGQFLPIVDEAKRDEFRLILASAQHGKAFYGPASAHIARWPHAHSRPCHAAHP